MITRVAVPDDAAEIAQIHVRSWQEAYRGLLPQDFLDALAPAQRTGGWRESLAAQTPPTPAAVVITDKQAILGFARVCPTRDEEEQDKLVGELSSIYLRPDTWRQGLGRQLMTHALDLLREAGNAAATLWVLQGNTRAIAFYEANGWSADGALKHATIADVPVTEIRYRISLLST